MPTSDHLQQHDNVLGLERQIGPYSRAVSAGGVTPGASPRSSGLRPRTLVVVLVLALVLDPSYSLVSGFFEDEEEDEDEHDGSMNV